MIEESVCMKNDWAKPKTEFSYDFIASLLVVAPWCDFDANYELCLPDAMDQSCASRRDLVPIDTSNVSNKSLKMISEFRFRHNVASDSQVIPLVTVPQASVRRRDDRANPLDELRHLVLGQGVDCL